MERNEGRGGEGGEEKGVRGGEGKRGEGRGGEGRGDEGREYLNLLVSSTVTNTCSFTYLLAFSSAQKIVPSSGPVRR